MSMQKERQALVQETVASVVRLFEGRTLDRALLSEASGLLQRLAAASELFPLSEFPAPARDSGTTSCRYLLSEQPDQQFALYINAINPGKTTQPHNHGTWAVIVALSGEELNRIYRRTDDQQDPTHASLQLEREVVVRPGNPIEFMPDDIHSIHVHGDQTVRHLHFYGQALETLRDRLGFELETGRILNYNANFMRPTVGRDMPAA